MNDFGHIRVVNKTHVTNHQLSHQPPITKITHIKPNLTLAKPKVLHAKSLVTNKITKVLYAK